jgi:hypothetical protein
MEAFLQGGNGEGDRIMLKLFDFEYNPVDFDYEDDNNSSPVPGYEEVISNWIEELASSTSEDELRELEEELRVRAE